MARTGEGALVVWLRIGLAALIALGGAVLFVIDRYQTAWLIPGGPIATGSVAIGGFVAAVDSAIQANRETKLERLRTPAARTITALIYELRDKTQIETEHLGLSLYLVRPRRFPRHRPRLTVLYEDRRGVRRVRSGIKWRVGKGVIGLCVAIRQHVVVDLRELDLLFEQKGDSGWPNLDRALRVGLSAKEMREVKGMYAVVAAAPIFRKGRAVGCIGLDAPPGSKGLIDSDVVRDAMGDAAASFEAILDRN